jgi:hypothetical protein
MLKSNLDIFGDYKSSFVYMNHPCSVSISSR